MRAILFLFLSLSLGVCIGQPFTFRDGAFLGEAARQSAAVASTVNYDVWLDFESNSDCTDGELEKTDNTATSQTYAASGSGNNCHNSDAEKTGTYGCSASCASATYLQLSLPYATNTLEISFWVYLASHIETSVSPAFLAIRGSNSNIVNTSWQYNSGNERIALAGGTSSTIDPDAWYWLTILFTSGSPNNIKMKVYNAALTQVGSELNQNTTYGMPDMIRWGTTGGNNTNNVELTYFDDIFIDYTGAAYPRSPYSP